MKASCASLSGSEGNGKGTSARTSRMVATKTGVRNAAGGWRAWDGGDVHNPICLLSAPAGGKLLGGWEGSPLCCYIRSGKIFYRSVDSLSAQTSTKGGT